MRRCSCSVISRGLERMYPDLCQDIIMVFPSSSDYHCVAARHFIMALETNILIHFGKSFVYLRGKLQVKFLPTSWRRMGVGVEAHIRSFFTSILNGGECSASCPSALRFEQEPPGTHSTGGWVSRQSLPPRFKTRMFSPGIEHGFPGHLSYSLVTVRTEL